MEIPSLDDDELLAKCGRDEPITSVDLGTKETSISGLNVLNEGFNILTYQENSKNEK